jgi:glycosyltransferase involved in cell wall biosynthesis
MTPISAVIITNNEAQNIERCLTSLVGVADEIVVVDSHSSDETENICKRFGVRFISHSWEGYSGSKNFGNTQASHNWILSLDADEALSPELKTAIIALKKNDHLQLASFHRLTNYCGHWVKYGGWYPDTKTRLFSKQNTQWKGILHEELQSSVPQKTLLLKGDCLHYSYYSREQHYRQAQNFSSIAAKELFDAGKKAKFHKRYLSPIVKFIRDYFIKLGFLDGSTGFTIARISAYATFLKYHKLHLLHKNFSKDSNKNK